MNESLGDTPRSAIPASPESSPDLPATGGKKGEGQLIEYSRARQKVSRRIAESKATIPHIYLQLQVRMDAAETLRTRLKATGGEDPAPTVTDLVIRATALALAEHPRANSSYRDGNLQLHDRINLGLAVDTEDGSLTPVITEADRRDLNGIAAEARRLAARARSGELTPPERSGATFAISNLGMFGVTGSMPVVDPGQSAKLSVGKVSDRPVVEAGRIVPGRVMELNLSCDHRALHGGEAARLLAAIGEKLERPEELTG
ncbi:MAG: 2-oxo acid dehydrogenase subunit E2 [Solirubrobacterales bacterium]|nr:2-oxo acid dehydrogenase subunit E2 [Solirubrobacterales bacterium]